jgi:butirosin biosynthesis protein H-like
MRLVLPAVRPWRHDLAGCLHACMATLLDFHGVEPVEALGAAWGFYYRPGDLRREEYYYPCRPGQSLLGGLAPHHCVRSRWHCPTDAAEGWDQVRQRVLAGQPVAVAVDNFELSFRPACKDVHTNHLVVVYGFDDERRSVQVLDAVPPSFVGAIGLSELTAARDSRNAANHARDMFFTDNPIANRWLEVEVEPQHVPPFDRATIRRVLEENLRGFRAAESANAYQGLAGQRRYLQRICDDRAAGEEVADELFVVAGAALASTALHADWLTRVGCRLGLPTFLELARQIERIAHHWTAIRIIAALLRSGESTYQQLDRRSRALHADQQRAIDEMEQGLSEL